VVHPVHFVPDDQTTYIQYAVTSIYMISRDSRKSRQQRLKNTANFCENHKNHGKIAAKTRHLIKVPKTIIQSIKLNI